ncbi:MAG: patatin-like phospholipase family protein [Sphingomonadales bacterium]|nr:MAG: patatin-like phospholipase family protein [Sphingomonadales bacterium]
MPDAPAVSPTNDSDTGAPREQGSALCLSGGGYRAMLFHVGSLWRLYEAGRLKPLKRISSVSGGSITAGVLALAWDRLSFDPASDDFARLVAAPLRKLAGRTIDVGSVLGGVFGKESAGERVAAAYKEQLFGDATLQDLPDSARFVINATNIQSGALWRFSKPYMADYRVGQVPNPTVPLALAVAASSSFPPILSPLTLDLNPAAFTPDPRADLQRPPFTERAVLSDGGVYDNLGLETVWKNFSEVLISDGGAKIAAEEAPKHDWPRHAYRVLDVIDNQVRSLRKRAAIAGFQAAKDSPMHRDGTYWGIGTAYADYAAHDPRLACPAAATQRLAQVPTRLAAMPGATQEKLVNWGYAVTDAALRSWVDRDLRAAKGFPYPASGV